MTFEEFFTKKRIDLTALEKAEPGLFSEFRSHFGQMGEKSFDHTKKYWFNKLRHQYHLAPEVKPEKVRVPDPPAEQTITERISETGEDPKPVQKIGFVPRFKATNMAKPAVEEEKKTEENLLEIYNQVDTVQPSKPTPKLGFTPKFRTAAPTKPTDELKREEGKLIEEKPVDSTEATAPKPAYKPRFNLKNMPPKKEE